MLTTETSVPALTLAQVESYHGCCATQALKDKLFLARAKAIVMRAKVDALLVPAFASTNYTDDDSGERITCEQLMLPWESAKEAEARFVRASKDSPAKLLADRNEAKAHTGVQG